MPTSFHADGKMLFVYAAWHLLFCLEFTKGVVSVDRCLSSLSEVIMVVGRGCSISKLLGLRWDGVTCGFAFIVLFTKVIVLFCIVV